MLGSSDTFEDSNIFDGPEMLNGLKLRDNLKAYD